MALEKPSEWNPAIAPQYHKDRWHHSIRDLCWFNDNNPSHRSAAWSAGTAATWSAGTATTWSAGTATTWSAGTATTWSAGTATTWSAVLPKRHDDSNHRW